MELLEKIKGYALHKESKEIALVGYIGNGKVKLEKLAEGTTKTVWFDCGKILARAKELQAQYIILIHNHPKGKAKPSTQDIKATRRVSIILTQYGLTLTDHFIIGTDGRIISMAENGHLKEYFG